MKMNNKKREVVVAVVASRKKDTKYKKSMCTFRYIA